MADKQTMRIASMPYHTSSTLHSPPFLPHGPFHYHLRPVVVSSHCCAHIFKPHWYCQRGPGYRPIAVRLVAMPYLAMWGGWFHQPARFNATFESLILRVSLAQTRTVFSRSGWLPLHEE